MSKHGNTTAGNAAKAIKAFNGSQAANRMLPDALENDTQDQILSCLLRIEDMLAPICASHRKTIVQHEEYIETVKRQAAPLNSTETL